MTNVKSGCSQLHGSMTHPAYLMITRGIFVLRSSLNRCLPAALAIALSACGGGGGGTSLGGFVPTTAASTAQAESSASNPASNSTPPSATSAEPAGATASSPPRVAPVAVVSPQLNGLVGRGVALDGSKSTGVQGKAKSYVWTLESKPAASNASIFNSTSQVASLNVDVAGTYVAKLTVSSDGLSSSPASTVVNVVERGALSPFLSFNASGLRVSDAVSASRCSATRAASNYATFWNFQPDPYQLICTSLPGAAFGDFQSQGSSSGGQLVNLGSLFLVTQGLTPKSTATWADISNIASYGFSLSAEGVELSEVAESKALGTSFVHSLTVAVAQPGTSGSVPFKIQGVVQPNNVPPGWEVALEYRAKVVLSGPAMQNGALTTVTVPVFEKSFTSDFSEDIPLNINWSQLSATFPKYALYQLTVSNRMVFKRIN